MANIFLSYSREDRPRAQIIAEAMEAEGLSVWWDKVLRAGQTYDEVTETMLREADVVIVLWSETSVKSKWVRAEATLGQRHCELVPVMIEDAERPIMFELIQTADLIDWTGDRGDERWINFIADIRRSAEKAAAMPDDAVSTSPAPPASPTPKPVAAAPAAPVAPKPQTPPPPTPTASATGSTEAAPKKKSSSLLVSLFSLAVVGIGGWFGYQATLAPSSGNNPEPTPPPVADCEICPDLVDLDGGAFVMGSSSDEARRSGNEGPQREVTLPAFSISAAEITWEQWQACVEAGACRAPQGAGSGSEPVTGVSWQDAQTYTGWLSSESGRVFRLPSEAEWEFAARGGTTSPYWWGNGYPGLGVVTGAARDTSSLAENPFGLTGMLGNVREWVADCYVNNYSNAPLDGAAVTNGDCSRRVVRGGSFRDGAAEHRSANRARYERDVRDRRLGFRVVAEPAR